MKTGSILLVAFLAPSLFCLAQDKAPAAQDTAKPAAPDAAKVAETDSYVIGATDMLAVSVFKEPTLSNTLLVRPDGMISMPLLGDVQASGKTPLQLADEITAKLKKYVQDPNVTVILSQMNSKKVYLMGEIGHTGPIEILRVEGGKQLKIPVQYKQALKGDLSLNLILNPGDTIVVP
jgi:polysaccharide export outer membrane protein